MALKDGYFIQGIRWEEQLWPPNTKSETGS